MSTDGNKDQRDTTIEAEIIDAEVVREESSSESHASDSAGAEEAASAASSTGDESRMKTVQSGAPKKKGGLAGWVVSGLLAAFLGGVYAAPYFETGMVALGLRAPSPAPDGGAASVDLAPLQAEIADLKASLARYQEILAQQQQIDTQQKAAQQQLREDIALLAGSSNPAGAIADASELVALKAEISRLSDDLARLTSLSAEADPAVSQLTGALALARAESAQLKERLSALENSIKAVEAGALEATPRGRLVLSLNRMKDRAVAGLPFEAELTGLRADIAALPALDQQLMGAELGVLQAASGGIRPYTSLVRDFDPAVAAALRAGEKEDGSFLTSLFTTRRTDAGATGDDAVIAKAERLLLARDVAGAVDALSALEGAVAETIRPWKSAAETHVAVLRAFDRLITAAAQAGDTRILGGRP